MIQRLTINKNTFVGSVSFLLCILICTAMVNDNCSYKMLAVLSVVELGLSLITIKLIGKIEYFSLPSFFLIFTWIFHCGQIFVKGFNIEAYIPLDFTKYASFEHQLEAFRFYLIAVAVIVLGILYSSADLKVNNENPGYIEPKRSSLYLILIGIVPRLYVDALRLIGGITEGYRGVYTLYIPQFVNTLAFFFDVGVIIKLLYEENQSKRNATFWFVLFYKSIAMLTGARQEKVAFLIVWIYIFFYIRKSLSVGKIVTMILIIISGVTLLDAIGNTRGIGTFSVNKIMTSIFDHSKISGVFGDSLGEFGSAFCSLELPFQQIPGSVTYGYGKSYIAGFLSVIPTLVSRIPILENETTFVTKFSRTTFFGGSFLGEAYYNLSWLGLIVVLISGYYIGRCHVYCFEKDSSGKPTFRSVISCIIAISLILFIRGYFTDMVQKIVWIYVFLRIINPKKSKEVFE